MGLSLVVGPAHAGKVALLLDRFVAALDRDPWLIVPNRVDVDRVERELAGRGGALLAGTVGTFDTLFAFLAGGGPVARTLGDAERTLVLRHLIASAPPGSLGPSARFAGFADSLAGALTEIEASLLDPEDLESGLAELTRAYRAELERLVVSDRGMVRRRAVERLTSELGSWNGAPVFAYGFEDLTGAEWRLIEALAARGEVHVSLPSSRAGQRCLAVADGRRSGGARGRRHRRARSRLRRLPAAGSRSSRASHLRRHRHASAARQLGALPRGSRPSRHARARRRDRARARPRRHRAGRDRDRLPVARALPCVDRDGIRRARRSRLDRGEAAPAATAFGQALLSLLRFAWGTGTRRELFSFLRTPYAGLGRSDVDFLEGRLRGRAVVRRDRTIEETTKLRTGRPLPMLELLADEDAPLNAARAVVLTMARNAYGLGSPPVSAAAKRDLRAAEAAGVILDELDRLEVAGIAIRTEDVIAALDRATVRGDAAGEPGRVAVLDLARARTRSFEAVFVIGLEQGSLPRRDPTSPFFDDETRRELDAARGARLQRPDAASRDRYLFYTACTRPRRLLTLVREAATDEGSPREPSPFWEAVCELFDADDIRRRATRRPLARLTWPIEAAPTERERLRSLARLAADDPREANALAYANGWQRKLGRARGAFSRRTAVRHPRALALLASRETFRVPDLERMASCSSAWFVERYLRPGGIDQAIDPMMRGSIAHVALQRFYRQLPAEIPGAERVTTANLEAAVALMHRCVAARSIPASASMPTTSSGASSVRGSTATSSSWCGPKRLQAPLSSLGSSRSPSRRTSSPRASRSAARSIGSTPIGRARGASLSTTSPAPLLCDADPRRGATPDSALPPGAARRDRARADGRRLHAARRG